MSTEGYIALAALCLAILLPAGKALGVNLPREIYLGFFTVSGVMLCIAVLLGAKAYWQAAPKASETHNEIAQTQPDVASRSDTRSNDASPSNDDQQCKTINPTAKTPTCSSSTRTIREFPVTSNGNGTFLYRKTIEHEEPSTSLLVTLTGPNAVSVSVVTQDGRPLGNPVLGRPTEYEVLNPPKTFDVLLVIKGDSMGEKTGYIEKMYWFHDK